MYSVFGTQAGNTMASTYNRGLLFYGYLAALGSSPVVSSLGCGTAASTSSTMTIPAGTASTWSGVSGAASVFTFSLMSDSTSY